MTSTRHRVNHALVPVGALVVILLASASLTFGASHPFLPPPSMGGMGEGADDLIVIDGTRDAAYGLPVGMDPKGDMTEVSLDLHNLYAVVDDNNWYIGFDARVTPGYGMSYGVYLDTDQVDGSGATTDPWGRDVDAEGAHRPEYAIYAWHDGSTGLQGAQLVHWTGTAWESAALADRGGAQGFSYDNDWLEYKVPRTALGNPARISLEVFTTGGCCHAQDTTPSDPNVTYTVPDWTNAKTTLSSFATEPLFAVLPGTIQQPLGCAGNWDPACVNTQVTDDNRDGVFKFTTSALPAGAYEYKVALNGSWAENYGLGGVRNGPNVALNVAGAGQEVRFYYDRHTHYLADNVNKKIPSVPGNFQSEMGCPGDWSPDCLVTLMQDPDGDGWYTFTAGWPAGTWEYKVALNESWAENYGAGGVPGGPNISITIPADGTVVTVSFNGTTHQIRDTINNPPAPGHDNDVWYDGLYHDSRDPLYRHPFGAVTQNTPVILRLRTFHNDVTGVRVRLVEVGGGGSFIPARLVASDATPPFGYDYWEATIPGRDALVVEQYRFVVQDGTKTAYYEDDARMDGGAGQAYPDTANRPWDIYVYDPNFSVPQWAKDAVIYQIFPERFRNGDPANDPTEADWFYPAERGHAFPVRPWNTIVPDPEPNDPSNPWYMTYSATFYGGDLQGITAKLDYLKELGVTTIYLNPIFDSPSNHKYDGRDYKTVDPHFGGQAAFDALVAAMDARGMHLVLDAVPNHTSSDSIYFDRFGRHPTLGACESADSPYRSWFYFRPASPPGTGECAGDTTYEKWFGVATLPKVNTTDNEDVRKFWIRDADAVGTRWLKMGADGWRVDVVPDIFPGFFKEWRPVLRAAKPDVQTYSETWGEADARTHLLGDEFDTTMNYRFRMAMLGFLRETDWSDGDGTIPALSPSLFDAALRAIQEDYPEPTWSTAMNLVDSHDTNRAVRVLDHDGINYTTLQPVNGFQDGRNRLKALAIVQMTLPGAPTIYYGDEVGLVGFGSDIPRDDPYNRQPYPWADQPGYDTLPDWRKAHTDLLDHYQKLTGLRHQYSFLRTGSWDTLLTDDAKGVYAYGRKDSTGVAVVVASKSTSAQTVEINVGGYLAEGSVLQDKLNDGATYTVTNHSLGLTVNGLWGAVLVSTDTATTAAPLPPINLMAEEGQGSVRLSWTAPTADPSPRSGRPPTADRRLLTADGRPQGEDVQAAAVGRPSSAVGYNVYRSLLSGGGYVKVNAAPVTTDGFIDTGVTNGVWYYYVVKSVNAGGLESVASNEVSALPHYTIGWANLQWPFEITHTISTLTPTENIYGQVWIDGVTNQPGATPSLRAQVGYGPASEPPQNWATWIEMTFNVDAGNNDEFKGQLLPEWVDEYIYTIRYSTTNGRDWVYADRDGIGGFNPARAGRLHVLPSSDTTPPAAPTGLKVTGTTAASISLAWTANTEPDVWAYQIYRNQVGGSTKIKGGADLIARVLAPATSYVDEDVVTNATYEYRISALDTSFNNSGVSNVVTATAAPRYVAVTFNVTVPAETPAGDVVYLPGNQPELGPWNPGKWAMTKVDDRHWTTTVNFLDGTQLEYKYTRGSWDLVEWWDEIHDLINRRLSVDYGTTGTQVVNDVVPLWRDPIPVHYAPEPGATGVHPSATMSALFNRALDPATVNSSNVQVNSTRGPVSGTVSMMADGLTVQFVPSAWLAVDTVYTVTLKAAIKGLNNGGGGLATDYSWSFDTLHQPTPTPTSTPTPIPLFYQVILNVTKTITRTSVYSVTNLSDYEANTLHSFYHGGYPGGSLVAGYGDTLPPHGSRIYDLSSMGFVPGGFVGDVLIQADQPITATVLAPPVTPTATPTATPTPTPTPVTVEIVAERADTGYVDSRDRTGNFLGSRHLYTGQDTRPQTVRTLHGMVQFNLSSLPPDVQLLGAEVVLTGLSGQFMTPGSQGTWNLRLLSMAVDDDWRSLGYWHIHNAPVLATVGPTLSDADLVPGQANRFSFGRTALAYLQARLGAGDKASFRLDGVAQAPRARHIFDWDAGAPPVLRVTYRRP